MQKFTGHIVFDLPSLEHPIVAAPMAGGPTTVELAAAVSNAGGLGFLAAGYRPAAALSDDIRALRRLTSSTFGVNVFVPSPSVVDDEAVARYAARLTPEEGRYAAAAGEPLWSDDDWDAKLEVILDEEVPVVSFAFGLPPDEVIADLHSREIAVWCTVTSPEEALAAASAGADALVVQGAEAGAHRGSFEDNDDEPIALLPLLRLVDAAVQVPLVATGGIADGRAVAAVLAAGASAAALGTAFLLCPEAGTNEVHRRALAAGGHTALTRAYTGRRARAIVNRFMREHGDGAPSAYPHVHFLTAPLRAAAREQGDRDGVNLWAGEAFALAREAPAADLVRRWAAEARGP